MSIDLLQLLCDRYEIADALHRYAFGLDHNDAETLASAFAEDCIFDFRPAGKKTGLRFPVLTGRDAIVDAVLPLIGPLDTSHSASNLQIEVSGDTAKLHAHLMSQHFMPREGSRRGSENALLMNRYDCELVRDGDMAFQTVTIDNAWIALYPGIVDRDAFETPLIPVAHELTVVAIHEERVLRATTRAFSRHEMLRH